MSVGLELAAWAYGTIEESSNGCTFDVAAARAIVNTTGVIVGHSRSRIPTIWTSLTGVGFDKAIQFWRCHVRARVAATVPTVGAGRRGKGK